MLKNLLLQNQWVDIPETRYDPMMTLAYFLARSILETDENIFFFFFFFFFWGGVGGGGLLQPETLNLVDADN